MKSKTLIPKRKFALFVLFVQCFILFLYSLEGSSDFYYPALVLTLFMLFWALLAEHYVITADSISVKYLFMTDTIELKDITIVMLEYEGGNNTRQYIFQIKYATDKKATIELLST